MNDNKKAVVHRTTAFLCWFSLLHAADLIHGVIGDDGVHVEMGREETVERLYTHKSVGHMLRRAFMTAVDGLAACTVSHRQPPAFF